MYPKYSSKVMVNITSKKLMWIVAASAAFSFLILNRWFVTELKLKSFGRLWQYYVSWGDFGFFRRGLVGTILTETGLNRLLQSEYLFAYLFYGCLMAISYLLVIKFILVNEKLRDNNALSFCVLLSPATFSHFAYSTGSNDLVLFVLLLLAVLYVRSAWALSLVLVSGVLVHELFIFLLPGIFVLKSVTRPESSLVLDRRLVVPAIAALVAIVVVTLAGRMDVSTATFEAVMAKRLPLAEHQHPLWSGYSELSYTLEDHRRAGLSIIQSLWANRWYLLVPTVYSFLVAWFAAWFLQSGVLAKASVFTVILFPLMAIFMATDYYRWVSLSACLGLVGALLLIARGQLIVPRQALTLLMVFSLAAPFGSAQLNWPFPLHQFVLERLTR